jgi:hypothetical protein
MSRNDAMDAKLNFQRVAQVRCRCGKIVIIKLKNPADELDVRCQICGAHYFLTDDGVSAFLREFPDDISSDA